jgi:hypothetical protein
MAYTQAMMWGHDFHEDSPAGNYAPISYTSNTYDKNDQTLGLV